MRINKYLRDKGYASRREADTLVAEGRVFVNGTKAEIGTSVEETDTVEVHGENKKYTYLVYYKPRRLPTQSVHEVDVITQMKKRDLFPVGRLDKDSEGLLLVTNDGRLTTAVLDSDNTVQKEYLVTVREPLKKDVIKVFEKGMETEAFGKLLPAAVEILGEHTMRIGLVEGKKHQIRVMLSELGYTTTSLKRVRIGPVTLGALMPGEDRPLTPKELTSFGLKN